MASQTIPTSSTGTIDFSQFPVDSFQMLSMAIGPFRSSPDFTVLIDEVLTALALYVYAACFWIDHGDRGKDKMEKVILQE